MKLIGRILCWMGFHRYVRQKYRAAECCRRCHKSILGNFKIIDEEYNPHA